MAEISQTIRCSAVVERRRRKLVRNPTGHKDASGNDVLAATYVDDGFDVADIEITIDQAALARLLGLRAMTSAHKTSKGLHGAVVAKARNIRRKDQ